MDTFERVFWPAFGVLALFVAVVAMIDACWRLRVRVPRCARCGYDLSGQIASVTRACPECGCDLVRWGVYSSGQSGELKKQRNTHADVRLFALVASLCMGWMLVSVAVVYPPFAWIERDATVITIGPTPAGAGTIRIDDNHVWFRTGRRSGERGGESHVGPTLIRSITATETSAGGPALDLADETLGFDDVLKWVNGRYPQIADAEAEALAFSVFAQSTGYWTITESERAALEQRASRAAVQPGIVTFAGITNGVNTTSVTGHGIWELLIGSLGTPTLAHAEAKHWWRLVGYTLWACAIVAVHLVMPRAYRRRCRACYSAWARVAAD